jgi:hypothetical protein
LLHDDRGFFRRNGSRRRRAPWRSSEPRGARWIGQFEEQCREPARLVRQRGEVGPHAQRSRREKALLGLDAAPGSRLELLHEQIRPS